MSHFRPVELRHASRLLNHGPTVLITSRDESLDRRNVMAAAWSMPVEFEPPRIAIVVDKSTWSRELIERSGKFGIVIPGVAAANWTYAVGSVSGRDEDKFNCYGIPVVNGPELGLPVNLHIADHPSCWEPLGPEWERTPDFQVFNLHGKDVPSYEELIAIRDAVLEKALEYLNEK